MTDGHETPREAVLISSDPTCRAMPVGIFSDLPTGIDDRAFWGSYPSMRAAIRLVSRTAILPGEWA